MSSAEPGIPRRHAPAFAWCLVLGILLVTAWIRWPLLDTPLDRDEGEYAYAGQLMLEGVPPYSLAYNMKLPGVYLAYAGILAVFGETARGIHLGLLLLNGATIVLAFLLGRRLYDDLTGVVTAAAFALLSVSPSVQGVWANAEAFVIASAMAGLVVLLRALDSGRRWPLIGSGLLMGTAFLMKQHGAAFIALGGLAIVFHELRKSRAHASAAVVPCALFGLAAVVPFALTCLALWAMGVFETFWFWTWDYAQAYTQRVPLRTAPFRFFARLGPILATAPLLWAMAGLGATALAWSKAARKQSGFVGLFVLLSILATAPGFFFRPHYFVLLLPAAALLVGIAARALAGPVTKTVGARRGLALALVGLALAQGLFAQRAFLFEMTPNQASRFVFQPNPFVESPMVASYLRERTTPEDRIAIVGSEPQIAFYAGRKKASGFTYTYALMEPQPYAERMHRQMIAEIEASEPKYLVYVNVYYSWLSGRRSKLHLQRWLEGYLEHFRLVARVEITAQGSRFLEGATLDPSSPRPENSLEIYERLPER